METTTVVIIHSFISPTLMTFTESVQLGIRQSLNTEKKKSLFLIISALSFALLFSLPVFTVPENTFAFQLSITRWQDVSILLLLSLVISLTVALQIESRKCAASCKAPVSSAVGQGGAITFGAIGAALLATAACSSCLIGVLGIIGLGTTVAFALLNYRWYIIGIVFIVSLLSILFTAKKIGSGACSVSSNKTL